MQTILGGVVRKKLTESSGEGESPVEVLGQAKEFNFALKSPLSIENISREGMGQNQVQISPHTQYIQTCHKQVTKKCQNYKATECMEIYFVS